MRTLWPSTPSAPLPRFRASSPHPTSPFLPSHEGTGGGAPPALPAPPTAPTWSQARPLLPDPGASRPGLPAATSADRGGGEQTGVLPASDRGPLWSGRRKPPRTSLIAAGGARWRWRRGEFAVTPQPQASCPAAAGRGPHIPGPPAPASHLPRVTAARFSQASPRNPDPTPAPLPRSEPLAQTSPRLPSKGQIPQTQEHLLI